MSNILLLSHRMVFFLCETFSSALGRSPTQWCGYITQRNPSLSPKTGLLSSNGGTRWAEQRAGTWSPPAPLIDFEQTLRIVSRIVCIRVCVWYLSSSVRACIWAVKLQNDPLTAAACSNHAHGTVEVNVRSPHQILAQRISSFLSYTEYIFSPNPLTSGTHQYRAKLAA